MSQINVRLVDESNLTFGQKLRRNIGSNAKVCIAVGSGILFIAVITFALSVSSAGLKNAIDNFSHDMKTGGRGSSATVGAYYYPWYGDGEFHEGTTYLRQNLQPRQYPKLGEYDDTGYNVLSQHLAWSSTANIKLWILSWLGPGDITDKTIISSLFTLLYADELKMAVNYESSVRTEYYTTVENVFSDVKYLAYNYFTHSNYYRVNDLPVFFIKNTMELSTYGLLGQVVNYTRAAAYAYDEQLYIVGDFANGVPQEGDEYNVALFDAITCGDVAASLNITGYVEGRGVNQFAKNQASWAALAYSEGVDFIPAATPGFNDMGVSGYRAPISRKLTSDSAFGSLFRAMLEKTFKLMDPNANYMVMIDSFNRWDLDTQIEPVKQKNGFYSSQGFYTAQDNSATTAQYTYGLPYEEYGERYINILAEETAS